MSYWLVPLEFPYGVTWLGGAFPLGVGVALPAVVWLSLPLSSVPVAVVLTSGGEGRSVVSHS